MPRRDRAGSERPRGPAPWSPVWAALLIVVATAAIYANSLSNQFLFDDLQVIVEAQVPAGAGALDPLRALLSGRPSHRPIRSASYAFDFALSGLEPTGYHLSNIAFHAIAALVAFGVAQSMFGAVAPALVTTLLFAVHPIQTESVAYLSGRRDLLSGLFVLGGVLVFLRYRRHRQPLLLPVLVGLYLLAFFSKESGIVLPLLCLTADLSLRVSAPNEDGEGGRWRAAWLSLRGAALEARLLYLLWAAMIPLFAWYVLFFAPESRQTEYWGGSLWFTLLTMARVVVHYLSLLAFPLTLNADYSYDAFPVTTSWTDPKAWMAVAALLGLAYGLIRSVRYRPPVAFGAAWFVIALLPVSQLIPHHELMAEHFLYLPSFGFFLAVVALLQPLMQRRDLARPVIIASSLVLLLLSVRTVFRNADWQDELTLWRQTVATAPRAARARANLGATYLRLGRLSEAEEQLQAAVAIKPDLAVAHANLGKLALDRRDLDRAETELEMALTLKSDEVIPRLWLGGVYLQQGDLDRAAQQFQAALAQPVYSGYALNNLGIVAAKQGRLDEAARAFAQALEQIPALQEARVNLARVKRIQGQGPPTQNP